MPDYRRPEDHYHTRDLDRQLDDARLKVKNLICGFDKMEKAFRAMAEKILTADIAKDYMAKVFPLPENPANNKEPAWITEDRANCLHLYYNGIGHAETAIMETVWTAYNGVTEYVDHWRDRGGREHMHTVCFGRGFQIKARAYEQACALADVVVDM